MTKQSKHWHLTKNETVVDAYCGVGTIGLSLAKHAKEVRGMDIIPQAIENAKENARRIQAIIRIMKQELLKTYSLNGFAAVLDPTVLWLIPLELD